MEVYVVTEEVDYEGSTVLGVYATRKRAEDAVTDLHDNLPKRFIGMRYEITEWKVTGNES